MKSRKVPMETRRIFSFLASFFLLGSLLLAAAWQNSPEELLAFLCAVLWHETGHLTGFLLCGLPLPDFSLCQDGLRLTPVFPLTVRQELTVVFMGPFFNLAAGVACCRIFENAFFGVLELLTGFFQLLPLPSFDGSRLLRLFLLGILPGKRGEGLFRLLLLVFSAFFFFFSLFFWYTAGAFSGILIFSLYLLGKSLMACNHFL